MLVIILLIYSLFHFIIDNDLENKDSICTVTNLVDNKTELIIDPVVKYKPKFKDGDPRNSAYDFYDNEDIPNLEITTDRYSKLQEFTHKTDPEDITFDYKTITENLKYNPSSIVDLDAAVIPKNKTSGMENKYNDTILDLPHPSALNNLPRVNLGASINTTQFGNYGDVPVQLFSKNDIDTYRDWGNNNSIKLADYNRPSINNEINDLDIHAPISSLIK
jgi:hypothetical protein